MCVRKREKLMRTSESVTIYVIKSYANYIWNATVPYINRRLPVLKNLQRTVPQCLMAVHRLTSVDLLNRKAVLPTVYCLGFNEI